MLIDVFPFLFVGFGLGVMHALDADHIMAVSVLSNQKLSFKRTLLQCGHWALGHAGVLVFCGVLLFGLGIAIPEAFQTVAEIGVGILLIVLGFLCLKRFRADKMKLEVHRHGDVVHAHWHDSSDEHLIKHNHKPVFVGMLHGLAGSAPALALIPAVANGQFILAILYLMLFSLGVMLAMLCFGLGFAHMQQFLSQRYQAVFQLSRHILALLCIVFGGYWLLQAI